MEHLNGMERLAIRFLWTALWVGVVWGATRYGLSHFAAVQVPTLAGAAQVMEHPITTFMTQLPQMP